MPYDPEKHHRQSIRLRGYDYTQSGAYFVTIIPQNCAPLLGSVRQRQVHVNEAGNLAAFTKPLRKSGARCVYNHAGSRSRHYGS